MTIRTAHLDQFDAVMTAHRRPPRSAEASRVRGFRLTVQRRGPDAYGLTLDETYGQAGLATTVVRVEARHVRRVLPAVLDALRASGQPRSVIGPQRRDPVALSEEAGVRLALVLLATGPVRSAARADAMQHGVAGLATEEAYYWFAKCVGGDGPRMRRALRLFLAEE
jgi:hypothetical protein